MLDFSALVRPSPVMARSFVSPLRKAAIASAVAPVPAIDWISWAASSSHPFSVASMISS